MELSGSHAYLEDASRWRGEMGKRMPSQIVRHIAREPVDGIIEMGEAIVDWVPEGTLYCSFPPAHSIIELRSMHRKPKSRGTSRGSAMEKT
jgi:hypothetical protein